MQAISGQSFSSDAARRIASSKQAEIRGADFAPPRTMWEQGRALEDILHRSESTPHEQAIASTVMRTASDWIRAGQTLPSLTERLKVDMAIGKLNDITLAHISAGINAPAGVILAAIGKEVFASPDLRGLNNGAGVPLAAAFVERYGAWAKGADSSVFTSPTPLDASVEEYAHSAARTVLQATDTSKFRLHSNQEAAFDAFGAALTAAAQPGFSELPVTAQLARFGTAVLDNGGDKSDAEHVASHAMTTAIAWKTMEPDGLKSVLSAMGG